MSATRFRHDLPTLVPTVALASLGGGSSVDELHVFAMHLCEASLGSRLSRPCRQTICGGPSVGPLEHQGWGTMKNLMRRIAVIVGAAAVSVGLVGAVVTPADASTSPNTVLRSDSSWPY